MPATPTLDILESDRDGVELLYIAPLSDIDTFLNTGKEVVLVKLASGITITITTTATVDAAAGTGLAVNDRVLSLGPGEFTLGPFPPNIYNDDDGLLTMSYGGDSADVEVAVLRLP